MHFEIQHTLRYTYDSPVVMEPALIRLSPRTDAGQQVLSAHCAITPAPAGQAACVDLDGNSTLGVWFSERSDFLSIVTACEVRTLRTNAFEFMLMPPSMYTLPALYPNEIFAALAPYLQRQALEPEIMALAQSLMQEAKSDTMGYLVLVCSHLAVQIFQQPRETGGPMTAAETWQKKIGACRDVTVLFMELCRAVGLAARFVSGYVLGLLPDLRPELHAWAEVYLPGGGWRGFDPSMGIAVCDRHVAVAAAARPENAAPVSGTYRFFANEAGGGGGSQLWYDVNLHVLD
ncbi:MAG: transglutaminase family protein [Planctomycetota bacterium]